MSNHVILKWAPGPDKLEHALVGFTIGFCLTAAINPFMALAAALISGIGKEVYDYFHRQHDCDIWDALCTFGGGVFGVGVAEIVRAVLS